jgi:hypothetical protein
MKTTCWSLLLAVCAGTGCITLPSVKSEDKKPAPPPRVTKPVRQAPTVTESQVNEDNLRDKLKEMRAELDREANGEPAHGNDQ